MDKIKLKENYEVFIEMFDKYIKCEITNNNNTYCTKILAIKLSILLDELYIIMENAFNETSELNKTYQYKIEELNETLKLSISYEFCEFNYTSDIILIKNEKINNEIENEKNILFANLLCQRKKNLDIYKKNLDNQLEEINVKLKYDEMPKKDDIEVCHDFINKYLIDKKPYIIFNKNEYIIYKYGHNIDNNFSKNIPDYTLVMVTNHGKVFMNYNDNNDNLCSGYCDFAGPINQMILQIIMPLALVDKTNKNFKIPFLVNGHDRFKGYSWPSFNYRYNDLAV